MLLMRGIIACMPYSLLYQIAVWRDVIPASCFGVPLFTSTVTRNAKHGLSHYSAVLCLGNLESDTFTEHNNRSL